MSELDTTPDIVLCPGGPALLRGDHVVEDEDGRRHRTTRPVSAVCRCGHTSTSPWCDGTHKVARPGRRGRAPASDQSSDQSRDERD